MKTTLSVIGGVLRFVFNIGIVVVGIYLAYNFASLGYDYAKEISSAAFENDEAAAIREVSVTIPQGATTETVAEILYSSGLIGSVSWFRIQSRLDGMDGQYKAGKYTLSTNMSDADMMDYIAKGASGLEDMIKLTIPEGYTAAQIGSYLDELGICTAEEFRNAMNNSDFDYEFVKGIPVRGTFLEGYLFPDTYFLDQEITPVEIVSKMLNRFQEVYYEEIELSGSGLTMDEIVTRASIIEAEIRIPEERSICASVIQNRLDAGMPLQMDATVQYALGERKKQLLIADLEVDSPYNTYKYPGLPIGPICNPGRASIRAALNPADTDFMYYVVSDLDTGEHEFTVDYESFLEAKQRYVDMQ